MKGRKNAVKLTPKEQEKLMLHFAGELAAKRRARGLKLNYVEAVAYLSAELLEMARDGKEVADNHARRGKAFNRGRRHGRRRRDGA